ncbi:MAG: agmatine deiminase family protein [Verrucomicrobia bacterium]|nr:agmatine deiminase family protein [Verrucomicrobiota bacterium]
MPPRPAPPPPGYRFPAEWEPHAGTWLSWPRPEGISFPGRYEEIQPALVQMVTALGESERVHINVSDERHERLVRRMLQIHGCDDLGHVTFHRVPTNEPWCRDHGPIFLTHPGAAQPLLALDWGYNAWGGKYPPFDHDDAVPRHVAQILGGLPIISPGIVMEGGSIEVNGAGSLLTTTSCLLNPNRNPSLGQAEIEQYLKDYFCVRHVLWLGDGIEGDDTDGHIDDITRFLSRTRVLTVVEPDPTDPNHEPLRENLALLRTMRAEDGTPLEIVEMPMPPRIERDGQRLPASHANYYVANKVVLLPAFGGASDEVAARILAEAFPGRRVVPIDCRELIWGLGAFHCLTQQVPAV